MLFWLDLETTGLNPKDGRILEVAAVVTKDDLTEIGAVNFVIHNKREDIAPLMNDYVTNMHTTSGLLAECEKESAVFLSIAEEAIVSTINKLWDADKPILCGSSVHFDRNWIEIHMPRLHRALHYRHGDASGSYELAKRIAGLELPKPQPAHRALADIRDSIELARVVFAKDKATAGSFNPLNLTISAMQVDAHRTAKDKGFWGVGAPLTPDQYTSLIATKLALIHSEVSEAVEELRKDTNDLQPFTEELADVLIRVGDLAGFLNINLADEVAAKLEKNKARPVKHGKRF